MKQAMQLKKGRFGILGIIVAAVLIEMTAGGMYHASQRIIQSTMERLVRTEMNAIYLCMRNKLIPVEVTIYNEAWVMSDYLNYPEDIYQITQNIVAHNPSFIGSGVAFIPEYYPQRARYFEPYSARQADGTIKMMQLGADGVDHTGDDYFRVPIKEGRSHWSEPYMDPKGAKTVVTTFGVPVLDAKGKRVAVAYADVAIDWLDEVAEEAKQYRSTQRFIVSGKGSLIAGEDNAIFRAAFDQVQTGEHQEGYVVLTDEEGKKRHVFYHPIGGQTDWILISVLDDDEVFGALKHVRWTLWGLLAIGLCVMGFILWLALRNIDKLQRVNTEKARIDTELKVANEIQYSMLPHGEVKDERIKVKGFLKPAREVGGDLYDYYVRDEKLFFCIGDVSGKGAASAMLMGVTHSLFRSASAHETNPARIMTAINEASAEGNEKNMFVTLFIGVLDLPTGKLRYCNAGHDQPIQLSFGHSPCTILDCEANLPVGVFGDTKYSMQQMTLEAGTTLFLYTDGLTEAKDLQRKQFGLERVVERLKMKGESLKEPQQIIEDMMQSVQTFVGEAEQSDDLTMFAIKLTGIEAKGERLEAKEEHHFSLVMRNDIQQIPTLAEWIEMIGLPQELNMPINLALEEAVSNVMLYAYPGKSGQVLVECDKKVRGERLEAKGQIIFTITDSGVPFDPTQQKEPDVTQNLDERPIGGLGIFLVRQIMDDIRYERKDNKNILTLTKQI